MVRLAITHTSHGREQETNLRRETTLGLPHILPMARHSPHELLRAAVTESLQACQRHFSVQDKVGAVVVVVVGVVAAVVAVVVVVVVVVLVPAVMAVVFPVLIVAVKVVVMVGADGLWHQVLGKFVVTDALLQCSPLH